MTSFKLLVTLLSAALVASASTMPVFGRAEACDAAACIKAVASVAPAVAGCVSAGEDLSKLNEDDDDDKKKQAPGDAAKAAAGILDCVSELISSAADLNKDCPPCLQSIGGESSSAAPPATPTTPAL